MKEELLKLSEFPSEIRWLGDKILRQKSEKVTLEDIENGKAANIVEQLETVLKKIQSLGMGVALAAPQIGIPKAITIVYSDKEYLPFINPVITHMSEQKNSFPEGCLSSLPLVAETIRPSEIDVTYLDKEGEEQSEHFEGKMARVLQHEIDHLNGILFIDKANLTKSQFVADFEEYKNTARLIDL